MLTALWETIEDLREDVNKEIQELKKSHSDLKNTVTEMKYTIGGMNNGFLQVEETIR